MNTLLIAALIFAALESLALYKQLRWLEFIAKPGVMLALFCWVFTSIPLEGAAVWFVWGIFLSLAGDIFLMISLDRFFMFGLISFLLAHIAYIVGFNTPLPELSAWSIMFAVVIALGGARLIRRILDALAGNHSRMRIPVIVYSIVISIMLLSAMMKLMDISWTAGAAALVSLGAFLFYLSDIILAWNKFVAPINHGRIYNIAAYHLGQIAIIAGVILHFGG